MEIENRIRSLGDNDDYGDDDNDDETSWDSWSNRSDSLSETNNNPLYDVSGEEDGLEEGGTVSLTNIFRADEDMTEEGSEDNNMAMAKGQREGNRSMTRRRAVDETGTSDSSTQSASPSPKRKQVEGAIPEVLTRSTGCQTVNVSKLQKHRHDEPRTMLGASKLRTSQPSRKQKTTVITYTTNTQKQSIENEIQFLQSHFRSSSSTCNERTDHSVTDSLATDKVNSGNLQGSASAYTTNTIASFGSISDALHDDEEPEVKQKPRKTTSHWNNNSN